MGKIIHSLILLLLLSVIAESADKGLLVLANGRIRKEASKTGETVQGVTKGDTLLCGETKEGWCQVLDKSGASIGWIAASVVKSIEIAAPAPAAEAKKDSSVVAASPAEPSSPDTVKPTEKKDSIIAAVKDTAIPALPAQAKAEPVVAPPVQAAAAPDTAKPPTKDTTVARPAPETIPSVTQHRPGKISLISNAKLRAKPAPDGNALKVLTKGEKLDFTGEDAGWYRILNADGTEAGFVSKTVAEIITPPESSSTAAVVVQVPRDTLTSMPLSRESQGYLDTAGRVIRPGRLVATSNARVRVEPSTTAAVAFGVKLGDTLKYSNEESGFFRIVNDSLVTQGFISNTVVQVSAKPETLVVAAKDSSGRDTAIIAQTDSALGRADSTLIKGDSLAGVSLKPDTTVNDATSQKGAERAQVSQGGDKNIKDRISAYIKAHKKQAIIGGSSVVGVLILAVALSGGSGGGASPGGNPDGPLPSGRTEIPAINIPPPPEQ